MLQSEHYTSPDVFHLETERIFRTHWLCVGRAAEIPRPGDFLLSEAAGESLIVLRGDDGAVRAFYNVCRHRGARLCDEPHAGPVRTIVCPYHGWTYDTGGRLLAAPNMNEADGFDPAGYSLFSARAVEWLGFVLVNLADDPVPLEESYAPLTGRFARRALSELISVRRIEYEVAANWKVLFQNYSECYHCPRVHPALNQLSPFQSATNDLDAGPILGGPMQLAEGAESLTTDGRACGVVFDGSSAEERRRVYYYTIFPTMFVSPHPDYVLVHRLERIDAAATRVVCEFLFDERSINLPGFDPGPAVDFWERTNRQDWRVCELVQKGVNSPAYRPGPYAPREPAVRAFDEHYLRVLTRSHSEARLL